MSLSLDELLRRMTKMEASDLYIAAEAKPVAAVHGELTAVDEELLTPMHTEALAKECMNEKQYEEFRAKLEMNLAYRMGGNRFRINVYYQRGTVALVARLIRADILSVEQLGLPGILNDLVMRERGIVLVTGATGSGKSTTLAAMIDYRNRNSTGHIVTVEDPVEFVHEHKRCIVSQREVGIDTISFHEAMKSALRQAPKVILLGEIRDGETAAFALHASDTGHLVLATLHTNSANQTLERLINLFPPESERTVLLQLSLNLGAIICQRLVPKQGGGRVSAVEIMINTSRIQELIQQGSVQEIKTVMSKGAAEGMQTFDMALYDLVKSNLIEEPVALKFADSANDLKLKLRGFGVSGFA